MVLLDDPIAALIDALDRDGAPDHEWVVRWIGETNRDPLANAWAHSHDLIAMAQLVDLLQLGALAGARRHNDDDSLTAAASLPDPWTFSDSNALRRAVGAPPRLAQAVRARASLAPSAPAAQRSGQRRIPQRSEQYGARRAAS